MNNEARNTAAPRPKIKSSERTPESPCHEEGRCQGENTNNVPRNCYGARCHRVKGLAFDMSGGWRQAKPAGRRPLDGRVRRHLAWAIVEEPQQTVVCRFRGGRGYRLRQSLFKRNDYVGNDLKLPLSPVRVDPLPLTSTFIIDRRKHSIELSDLSPAVVDRSPGEFDIVGAR